MFDTVGKDLDEGAVKRQAASASATLLLIGSIVGGIAAYNAYRVVQTVVLPQLEEQMVEVELEDPAMEDEPPPPPPPPPSSGAQVEEEEQDEEQKPQVEEPVEEVKELDEKVEEKVQNDLAPKGAPGGVEGGVEGGQAGGVVGGQVGGTGTNLLGSVRTFHHSEIEWKVKSPPPYPEAAADMNLGEQNCRLRVFIDETGIPNRVLFESCPKVFQGSTEAHILGKWRAYPKKVAGQKVSAQFLLNIKFTQE